MIMESSKQKNRYFHSLFISQRKVGKVLEKNIFIHINRKLIMHTIDFQVGKNLVKQIHI